MSSLDLSQDVHRRYNPLTGEWLLVSPHRGKRPWQGHEEKPSSDTRPVFDANCYLCPGNKRANGILNPNYEDIFIFDNDFAALQLDSKGSMHDGLLTAEAESGICRVICFSPRHDLTLANMSVDTIHKVVAAWEAQYAALAGKSEINYIQIFENKGAMMGCSNPHPHGQIWAQKTIPDLPRKEGVHQLAYYKAHHTNLLHDYLQQEIRQQERIVCRNEHWVALIPFWAFWPYETMVLPQRSVSDIRALSQEAKWALAAIIKELTGRYDRLFGVSFPYSAGLHSAPCDGEVHPEWTFHLHFLPPLFRSATVKKFRVGYEMLAMPQRDVTAETCAAQLRALS